MMKSFCCRLQGPSLHPFFRMHSRAELTLVYSLHLVMLRALTSALSPSTHLLLLPLPFLCARQMALAAGVYTIRLADGAASGFPADGYLTCHKYHEKDTRDEGSVYAMVHSAPSDGGWGGYKWFISPVGEGAYTIRLADATHGAAATGHLACHKYYAKDTRDESSVYTMVHGARTSHFDDDGYLGYKWLISPVGGDSGAFTIRLADAAHGAPATGSLASHKYYEKDTRDDVSVYAMVHSSPNSGCQWFLAAV